MNELLKTLQDKLGLNAEQAQGAITHVMDYLKSKLPASLHEHLDAAAITETLKKKSQNFLPKPNPKEEIFFRQHRKRFQVSCIQRKHNKV